MSYFCLRSLNPNISHVDQLYKDNNDEGHMHLGNGTPPPCSSANPPPPSNCTVCFNQFIYAVCSDLLKHVKLVMEGAGHTIDLTESECPGLLATNENADLSGNDKGEWRWWLLPLIMIPIMIIVFVVVFFYKKNRDRSKLQSSSMTT